MAMADSATWCRERADAERRIAEAALLANVRDQALRSAKRWEEMAARAERTQEQAAANRVVGR